MTIENAEGEQETIDSTPEHPFYVEGLGWVEASSLHAGMTIWFANGTKGTVEDISNEGLEEPVTVYNFEVRDFHTYFVGENGIFVHNTCSDGNNTVSTKHDDVDPTEGVDIHLKLKGDWSDDQIAAARNKADVLTNSTTAKTSGYERDNSLIRQYKNNNPVSSTEDVDHIIDLQLGGKNELSNLQALDSSVNRSFGRQIAAQIKNYDDGTVFGRFIIDE